MERNNGRIVVGIILIVLGIIYITRNMGIFHFHLPFHLFSWSFFFLILGVIILLNNRNNIGGFILVFIGLMGYFPSFWPLLLVGIGLYLLIKDKKMDEKLDINEDDGDYLNDIAILGGGKKIFHSDKFCGGSTLSIFGGAEIDLSFCKLKNPKQVINITSIFGGTSFRVPKDWNVQIDVVAIFGGFSDKRLLQKDEIDYNKTLVIKGLVLFGGGEIN